MESETEGNDACDPRGLFRSRQWRLRLKCKVTQGIAITRGSENRRHSRHSQQINAYIKYREAFASLGHDTDRMVPLPLLFYQVPLLSSALKDSRVTSTLDFSVNFSQPYPGANIIICKLTPPPQEQMLPKASQSRGDLATEVTPGIPSRSSRHFVGAGLRQYRTITGSILLGQLLKNSRMCLV